MPAAPAEPGLANERGAIAVRCRRKIPRLSGANVAPQPRQRTPGAATSVAPSQFAQAMAAINVAGLSRSTLAASGRRRSIMYTLRLAGPNVLACTHASTCAG